MLHTQHEHSKEFRERLESFRFKMGRALDYATGQLCPAA